MSIWCAGWRLEMTTPASVRNAVQPSVHGRDVQRCQTLIAERAVRGATGWDGVLFQDGAVGAEDGDARPGTAQLPTASGHDVPGVIPAHAVDAARLSEVMQRCVCPEQAVLAHRISAQLAH